tara:strand:+ start:46 stop:318 length:273 start_codon:yes stop_codon:yes gene_type:complete
MIRDLDLTASELKDNKLGGDPLVEDYLLKTQAIAELADRAPLNNYEYSGSPGIATDASLGFAAGSEIWNGLNLFKCVDSSEGAAVWIQIV